VLTTAFQNGCEKKVAQMHFASEPTLAFPNSGRDDMTVTGNTPCRTASGSPCGRGGRLRRLVNNLLLKETAEGDEFVANGVNHLKVVGSGVS
jgi:hypothetical protein